MKTYVINPVARTIQERELPNVYPAAKEVIGGWLERAAVFLNGDSLWVDEEGLLKEPRHFFLIPGYAQPFAGIGVLSGREENNDEDDDSSTTADVKTTIAELRGLVTFLDRAGFNAWVAASGDRPASRVVMFGSGAPTVVSSTTYSQMFPQEKKE